MPPGRSWLGSAWPLRRTASRWGERAGAHQPLGVGGPKAGVQAGERVEGIEELLGEGKVRICSSWHTYLPGRQTVLGGRALPSCVSSHSVPGLRRGGRTCERK